MAKLDVPNLQEVLVASSNFPAVQGYYPGSGPDGSGETDAPDGPFKPISPMTFAVDHRQIPAYVLEAITRAEAEAGGNDPAALERALLKELEAMGVDPADVGLGDGASTAESGSAPSESSKAGEGSSPKAGQPGSNSHGLNPGKDSTPST